MDIIDGLKNSSSKITQLKLNLKDWCKFNEPFNPNILVGL